MPELERALRELGGELAYPPLPDLAGAVVDRLPGSRSRRSRRRALELALAVTVALAGAALAVPHARTALLELLGIRGATVERVGTLPAVAPHASLVPGARVSFEEAQAAVDFRLLAPKAEDGGRCGAFYLDRSLPGGMVSVVCPEHGGPQYVLTQFRGAQTPYVDKHAGPGTKVSSARVGESRGIWIEGAPHVVRFRDAAGEVREETRRLAGSVLLWERGGITYRLEGALRDREDGVRVATDLR